MSMVHCAITRVVREGKECEFEEALKCFVARSLSHHGTTGAHLLHPTDASRPREYGILRSFTSAEQMREFYDSDLFAQWQVEVAPLVEGEPLHRQLHGLEAFFRSSGSEPPVRWKMAIVTWLGVFPVVLFWSRTLPTIFGSFNPIAITGVVTGVAVVTLTWLVMPLLTRLFAGWIQATSQSVSH
ncbi:MAG: antibiotic biosynthesis monooxygenase [Planctomycetota bacterium]